MFGTVGVRRGQLLQLGARPGRDPSPADRRAGNHDPECRLTRARVHRRARVGRRGFDRRDLAEPDRDRRSLGGHHRNRLLRCRGRYLLDDLQVFKRRQQGGACWFTHGWSWRAVVAWAAGAAIGVLAINSTLYTCPLADIANAVDVSFVGSFAIAAVLYGLFRAKGRADLLSVGSSG